MISLYEHQKKAIEQLRPGSILCGGVGSGKSLTALAYYFTKIGGGKLQIHERGGFVKMKVEKNLYIITTAMKRDSLEWENECKSLHILNVTIDSWNNIGKYIGIQNAFFIFDEQRIVGAGAWVKSFLKIVKTNQWILLSATPGDVWMDYVPVFIANGFFKNRTEFCREHVVYSRFSKYPKIDRYINEGILIDYRKRILVDMKFNRATKAHNISVDCLFNKTIFHDTMTKRWNFRTNEPFKTVSELCLELRRIVNSDQSRLEQLMTVLAHHKKVILFYNFNYELEAIKEFLDSIKYSYSEWNGQKHQLIPATEQWVYLVQYLAGAEGWNCIETDTVIFYSQNYSYRITTQAAGRIDRMNTPFTDLYYYHFKSRSYIDQAIAKALSNKRDFNESRYLDI